MFGLQKNVSWENGKDQLIAHIGGEIDHHRAVDVRVGIDDKLIAERPKRFGMELSNVDFCDSSGLGLIMGRFALCKQYGTDFYVLNPSPAVMKMIQLAGMQKMLAIRYSEEKCEEKKRRIQ